MTEIGGAYFYVLARISQFLLKTDAASWVRAAQERSSSSSGPLSSVLLFPAASIEDAVVPRMVHHFTMFVHVFGLEHVHTVGVFVDRVVHDTVSKLGHTWLFALELLVVYLKALDERADTLTMGKIWDHGAHDMYFSCAKAAFVQRWGTKACIFRSQGGGSSGEAGAGGGAIKWNGKFTSTPSDARPCITYNLGRNVHPQQCLLPDGTCKHNHVCEQFVTGKGPNAISGSTAQARHNCDNESCQGPPPAVRQQRSERLRSLTVFVMW